VNLGQTYNDELTKDKGYRKERVDEDIDLIEAEKQNAKTEFEFDRVNMFGVSLDEAD